MCYNAWKCTLESYFVSSGISTPKSSLVAHSKELLTALLSWKLIRIFFTVFGLFLYFAQRWKLWLFTQFTVGLSLLVLSPSLSSLRDNDYWSFSLLWHGICVGSCDHSRQFPSCECCPLGPFVHHYVAFMFIWPRLYFFHWLEVDPQLLWYVTAIYLF